MQCLIIILSLILLTANVSTQICRCGTTRSSGIIIGGVPVSSISKVSWMAMITYSNGRQFCGGTVIASRAILTAAHCTKNVFQSDIRVVVGVLRRRDVNRGNMMRVRKIINYPKFDWYRRQNDISILILENDIDLIENPPICLSTRKQTYSELCMAGWGREWFHGPPTPRLMQSCFRENDFNMCNSFFGNWLIPDIHITAGDIGKGGCRGDSGGPLYTSIGGRITQVGISSFVQQCSSPCTVFTRVSNFQSWIHDTISKYGGGHQCQ